MMLITAGGVSLTPMQLIYEIPHQHVNLGERKPRPLNIVGTDTYWHAKKKQGVKSEMLMRFSGIPKLREFLFRIRGNRSSQFPLLPTWLFNRWRIDSGFCKT